MALSWAACSFDATGVPGSNDGGPVDAPIALVDASIMTPDAVPDTPDATQIDATPPIDALLPNCYTDGAYTDDPASNRRYRVNTDGASWTDARDACANDQAYLVVIGSAEENAHVRGLTTGRFWIGYNDIDDEGNFEWVNGEAVVYENWGGVEPNDFGVLGEDCAEMRGDDMWNDDGCASWRASICECDPDFIP